MSILWISLVLIYSIANVVPAEAKALADCPRGTKNPYELASDGLDTYNTELNQIISGNTFEEFIQAINNRMQMLSEVLFYWPNCKTCQNSSICSEAVICGYLSLSKDSLVDLSVFALSSALIQNSNDVDKNVTDILDAGLEKIKLA